MNISTWEELASKLLTSAVGKPSENFHSIIVDVTPDEYRGYDVHVTYLFKTYFSGEDSEKVYSFRPQVIQYLKSFLPELGDRVSVSQGSSTIGHYENVSKPWYEKKKSKNIDESIIFTLKDLNNQLLTEASKKKILIDKVGLTDENAELLDRVAGSLSVIIANKLVDFQLYAIKSWRSDLEPTKQDAIDKLNSGNLKHLLPKVTEIMDWIRVGLNGNLGDYKNLSLKELLKKSSEWHDSLGVSSGQINYEEKNPILIDFRNKSGEGFYWVDLETNYSEEECERMGHCGRTGYGNTLYSLRENKKLPGDKYTINKSHLTASIGSNGTLYQLKGPKNSKPKKEYHNYILPLFYELGEGGEEYDYLIQGFGSEYASDRDFKITDLPNEVIIDLYQNRPELFNTRSLKRKLIELGLIEEPNIDYNITIKTTPQGLDTYIEGNWVLNRYKRKVKTPAGQEYEKTVEVTMFETILSGDAWELWDNDYVDWKSSLDYHVDEKNNQKIREILKVVASKENENFNLEEFETTSTEDLIEEWDTDHEIIRGISNATNTSESDDYVNYLYNELRDAIQEYGTIEKMDDSGIIFHVNVKPFLDDIGDEDVDEYMDRCDDDISCVFEELVNEALIDKPKFSPDDRWYPSIDDDNFNNILSDYLNEAEYHYTKR